MVNFAERFSIMGFLDFLFKKKASPIEEVVEKVTIPTPAPPTPTDYSTMFEEVKEYFGKLYKKHVKGTEWEGFNSLHIEVPIGVYYGYTKYTGETNRNGVKAVALHLKDDSKLIDLSRNLWKKYEKFSDTDGCKWIGYSDGDSVRVTIYKEKVLEGNLQSFLSSVGGWIATNAFNASLLKRAEQLQLPKTDEEITKAPSGNGYDFYYSGKYQLAGASRYVASPFVSFGYAKLEPTNSYNSKAVAIYTDTDIKVGYIAEKELKKYYAQTKGVDMIPLVIEAHYYNGKLYGWLYTFHRDESEYGFMANQFLRELENR